jgi:acyl carrier protein
MNLETRLEETFRRVFKSPNLCLRREMTAFDIPGWDSLSNIRLLVAIEKELSIRLDVADVVRLRNVGQLLDLVAAVTAVAAKSGR